MKYLVKMGKNLDVKDWAVDRYIFQLVLDSKLARVLHIPILIYIAGSVLALFLSNYSGGTRMMRNFTGNVNISLIIFSKKRRPYDATYIFAIVWRNNYENALLFVIVY